MRQQPTPAESWSEAQEVRLIRTLSTERRVKPGAIAEPETIGEVLGRRAVLTRTVENEVIPRLLMACRPHRLARAVAESDRPTGRQVAHLTRVVLNGSQTEAAAYVEAMHDGGTPTESLFLDLLAPTARQLGQMWEDDTCTFTDVTLGLLRLNSVMRLLSRDFAGDYDPHAAGPSALLVQMPGEQHGFGLAMVVQFFRRAGWNVRQEPVVTRADLVGIVQKEWFGIVGVSVACSERLEALATDIRAIRKHSRNPTIGIMVGGPPFVAHPQLAGMVGADTTATDGRQAVQQAHTLMARGR